MKNLFISETADFVGQEMIDSILALTHATPVYDLSDCSSVAFIVHDYLPYRGLSQGDITDYNLLRADDFVHQLKRYNISEVYLIFTMTHEDSITLISELFTTSGYKVTTLMSDIKPKRYLEEFDQSENHKVRSLQRMVRPPSYSLERLTDEYFAWLTNFSSKIVRGEKTYKGYAFYLFHPYLMILELTRNDQLSSKRSDVLNISGGLLAKTKQENARFEFRTIIEDQYLLTILYDFRPALPWSIYLLTQALVHLLVMHLFSEHLKWLFITDKRN